MTSALLSEAAMPPVVELRQYTLRPGRREALIELFERDLVEPQEELGMHVLGQFRDLDRPDRFVWLRGFPDMTARASALTAFYDGPVWAAHRDAANATMLDSDDVLLLRPVGVRASLDPRPSRPHPDSHAGSPVLTAAIHLLREPVDAEFLRWYVAEIEPVLEQAGSRRLALLETEPAANTFPRLPVREGQFAVVRLSSFDDEAALETSRRSVEASPAWAAITKRFRSSLVTAPQTLRLQPTSRSALR
jgi:quinol monooxygenase YgiN